MTQQLQPIDLVAPGSAGLNTQRAGQLLSPQWATRAQNCVMDQSRRLAARLGYSSATGTAISPTQLVKTLFEYRTGTGTTQILCAYNGGISNDIASPVANDISGAVTDADGRWWMQNFNNKVVGFQHGLKPIVYSGTSFATITESSGTAPTVHRGVGLAAYGRIWALDSDGQTIKYCGLLDETDWAGATAGQIDMSNIWTDGMDEVTAIAAFNSSLLVFGKNHIVVFDDDTGSPLGIDPNNLVVLDVLRGTGCLSQWTIQHIGTADIVFLSRNGIQSLGRVVQVKSNPLENVSKYNRDELIADVDATTDIYTISSCYSPEKGFYLLTFPTLSTPRTWCFSVRDAFTDDDNQVAFPTTTWDLTAYSLLVTEDSSIYLGKTDKVFEYGATTDLGTNISYSFHTPWLDLGENLGNRIKLLKRIGAIAFIRSSASITFSWATDFSDTDDGSYIKSVTQEGSAEFSIAEFSLAEFSGAEFLQILKVPARATGQYYKFKIESDVSGSFALQQLEMFAKIGRVA